MNAAATSSREKAAFEALLGAAELGGRDETSPFRARLRELRESTGLTQARAGEIVGEQQSEISRMERGEVTPSVDRAVHIIARLEDYAAGQRGAEGGAGSPGLDPSQMLSLWLGRAAAARIQLDPAMAFAEAERWLVEVGAEHPESRGYVERWRGVMARGPEAVMRTLTGAEPAALSMQRMSPFVGIIPGSDRARIAQSVAQAFAAGAS